MDYLSNDMMNNWCRYGYIGLADGCSRVQEWQGIA